MNNTKLMICSHNSFTEVQVNSLLAKQSTLSTSEILTLSAYDDNLSKLKEIFFFNFVWTVILTKE